MASGTKETATETLPTLPFDLLAEILCRLPVKLLLQLRCLCKSFNSLINDHKFARKHLRLSTTHHPLMITCTNDLDHVVLFNPPINSDFSTSTVTYPDCLKNGDSCFFRMRTCDGILCVSTDNGPAVLWNPSIRTFKILPPLDNKHFSEYSIGYDHCINNYKIVACSRDNGKTKVSVHTLGTDSWKRIQDFPCSASFHGLGIFVSGTINWLTIDDVSYSHVIISLDLEKESYQKLPLPDLEKDLLKTLGVLRDCLCISANSTFVFLDVWIMKEYGNKDSWTNLYRVPHMKDRVLCHYPKALYIFEDEQLLIGFYESQGVGSYKLKLVVYYSKNGTSEISEIQNISSHKMKLNPQVYIESLISPCS